MPSKSKAQQKFMGMVHALQKGDMKPSDASTSVKKAAQSMKKSDAKDYASTSHKGLPRKVKQEILNKLKEYANKMGTNTLGGDDYTSSKKGGLRDFDGYDNVDYNKDMPMDEAHYTAVANLGTKKSKENLDSFDELQKFMDKMKKRKAISVQVTKINGSKKQTIDYDWDGRNWVSKNKKGVKENFPSNWMQGRTSDYHTKLRGKKREYDDTNFDKENSGQTDLEEVGFDKVEHLKLLNLALKTMPGSPKQKEIIRKLNQVRKAGGMRPLKEATKPDFNSKGYKEASKLVAKLRSSVFKKMSDADLDQFRMVLAQAFDLKEYGSKLTEPFLLPKDEDKLDGTPPSKDAIDRVDEVMITLTQNIAKDIIPMNTWSRYASDGKKNAEFVKNLMRDLTQTLNKFYKSHNINVRVKEK